MKLLVFILLCLTPLLGSGQSKGPKPKVEEIRVKDDSTAEAALSFLNGYEWTIYAMVNGQSVSSTQTQLPELIRLAKMRGERGVVINEVKKKKTDGKFEYLPPKKIIWEGAKGNPKPKIEEIRITNDSSLAFLNGYEWMADMMVNGQSVTASGTGPSSMLKSMGSKKGGVVIYNIRKKSSDGKYQHLPPKRIISE